MDVVARIRAERVVAVLRRVADVDRLAAELADAGIGVIEVTLDDDDALASIERLRAGGTWRCSPEPFAPWSRPRRPLPPAPRRSSHRSSLVPCSPVATSSACP